MELESDMQLSQRGVQVLTKIAHFRGHGLYSKFYSVLIACYCFFTHSYQQEMSLGQDNLKDYQNIKTQATIISNMASEMLSWGCKKTNLY